MSKIECSICMETIKVIKYFQCNKCKIIICKQCLKDSLITYGKTHPNCPNCYENISYTQLAKIINKKFIQEDLLNHLTNIEYEVLTKEKIKLIANVLKNMFTLSDNQISKYITKYLNMYTYSPDNITKYKTNIETNENETIIIPKKKYTSIYKEIILKNVDELMNEFKKNIENKTLLKTYDDKELTLEQTIMKNIKEIHNILYTVLSNDEIKNIFQKYLRNYINENLKQTIIVSERDIRREINNELKRDKSKTNYIFRCNECEFGFINKIYICNSCHKKICNICLKKEHEDKCNEDDVKTAELIYKDTKPCPNCCTRIYKISGCNQMFCTYCKKGFDWSTGKIIETNFHNPHRMEWLRNGGQDNLINEECLHNYQIRFLNLYSPDKSNIFPYDLFHIQLLNAYYNYINDELNIHQHHLNSINNDVEMLILLVRYLYTKHNEKENKQIIPRLQLTEQKFKSKLKLIIKYKYFENIYVEIYQSIREILASALIRIDQILGYKYENGTFSLNQEDKKNIDNLYNNCYVFLKDIENNRINELELYLNMKFFKPVDFIICSKEEFNMYYWDSKNTGLKNFEEFYDIYKTLIEPNNEDIELDQIYTINDDIYKKYINRKLGIIFKNINNYIKKPIDRKNAMKNISKLNLTFEKKEFIYNLFQ